MKILVLAGGLSPERNVSLSSGTLISQALRKQGHDVLLADLFLGISAEVDLTGDFKQLSAGVEQEAVSEEELTLEEIRALRPNHGTSLFGPRILELCYQADIVFLALHGESGENGMIQATLESLGIAYTGSGHLASALAMDKTLSKLLFVANDIPTPAYHIVKTFDEWQNLRSTVHYPVVIKPSNGGSSMGVSIAETESEADEGMKSAFRFDSNVVLEEYVSGREFSIGFLGDQVLPPIEIIPKSGFYDYQNKYQPDRTEEICPANISDELTKKLQDLTRKTAQVLGLTVYSRIDFLVDDQENIYCLEGNSLPGMTPTSLLPQEAQAAGINYEDLCEQIIELSMQNNSKKEA